MLRNAPAWRALPEEFGRWITVFQYFRRLALDGFFDFVLSKLCCAQDAEVLFIDSTHLKVHQHAACGANGRAFEAIGNSRGGLNTKLHVLVDGLGRLAACVFTSGNVHDARAAAALIKQVKNVIAAGDKAFGSGTLIALLKRRRCTACIPPRSNRLKRRRYNKWLYRARHIVEIFFQRFKSFKRCATRCEKSLLMFSAFATLAFSVIYAQNSLLPAV